MAMLHVYRLRPKGGFHFGTHGIDAEQSAERCPSDTLYAALLVEARLAGRPFFAPPPDHTDAQPLDPPLLLSSCYPYAGEVLLLPRPQLRLPLPELVGQRKLFKNLAYVSPTIFRLILEQGKNTLEEYLDQPDGTAGARGALYMGGAVWVAHADGAVPKDDTFWQIDSTPHVTVDRLRDASAYYQVGQVRFAKGCGLYVLCQERHPGAVDGLAELLQRLGDSGIGGRRNQGLGAFAVEPPGTLELPTVEAPKRLVLLSRYRPNQTELEGDVLGANASYDLVRVGGWLQTPDPGTAAQRRCNVRLLSEGSVVQLPTNGSAPIGTICDVRPIYTAAPPFPHPVWRYGLALGVSIGGV